MFTAQLHRFSFLNKILPTTRWGLCPLGWAGGEGRGNSWEMGWALPARKSQKKSQLKKNPPKKSQFQKKFFKKSQFQKNPEKIPVQKIPKKIPVP